MLAVDHLTETTAVVTAAGELTVDNTSELRELVMDSIYDGATRLIIDLTKVSFIDSSVLAIMVTAYKQLQMASGSIGIVCTNKAPLKLFEITSLGRILGIYPTLTAALQNGYQH